MTAKNEQMSTAALLASRPDVELLHNTARKRLAELSEEWKHWSSICAKTGEMLHTLEELHKQQQEDEQ